MTIHVISGNVVVSWSSVTGALSYIVEASNQISTGYTDISTQGSFSLVSGTD